MTLEDTLFFSSFYIPDSDREKIRVLDKITDILYR